MRSLPTVLLLVFVFAASCATKATFRPSAIAPAAEAQVRIKRDDNGNAIIRLYANHLAPPLRLSPPRQFYVVWAETPEGRLINLGQLVVGKNLDGEFLGATSLERFRLLITAEDLVTTSVPGRTVVLETEMLEP